MKEKVPYRFEAHGFIKLKNAPWLYCKYCGLVRLNNALTRWCVNMGCNNEYHKDYKKMINKLSK